MYLYFVFFKNFESPKQIGVNCLTSAQFTPQQNKRSSEFATANSATEDNATLIFNTIHVKNSVHILLKSIAQIELPNTQNL